MAILVGPIKEILEIEDCQKYKLAVLFNAGEFV